MVLRKGSKGKEVERLQENLKALGFYPHIIDGDFGPRTHRAVLEFQQRFFVDGIVDAYTAQAVGEAVVAWATRDLNILLNVPAGLDDVEHVFGEFLWEEAAGGYIRIVDDWPKKNIVKADLPVVGAQLVHRKLVPVLESVLNEIKQKGLDGEIIQFGVWCPRHKMHDRHKGLSIHSWGAAVDINWATNPPGQIGEMDPGIVASFERHGFEWGGRWRTRDDMHFQYAKGV